MPNLVFLLLLISAAAQAAETPVMSPALPPAVQQVLDGHDLGQQGLSIVVQAVDDAQPLLSLNA